MPNDGSCPGRNDPEVARFHDDGKFAQEAGLTDRAIESFRRAVARSLEIGDDVAELHNRWHIALLCLIENRLKEGLASLGPAFDRDRNLQAPPDEMIAALLCYAGIALSLPVRLNAIQEPIRRAHELTTTLEGMYCKPYCHQIDAMLASARGDHEAAERSYLEAEAAGGQYTLGRYTLARAGVAISREDYQAAEDLIERADLDGEEEDWEIYDYRSRLAEARSESEEAVLWAERARDAWPPQSQKDRLHNQLADAYLLAQDLDRARQAIRVVAPLRRGDSYRDRCDFWLRIAEFHLRLARKLASVDCKLSATVTLPKGSAAARRHLAIGRRALKKAASYATIIDDRLEANSYGKRLEKWRERFARTLVQ